MKQHITRAPFQVLVLPFRRISNTVQYAIFSRSDDEAWQGIAGGGDDGESPMQAARRELMEESALPDLLPLSPLDCLAMVSRSHFPAHVHWSSDIFVIPEFAFGVDAGDREIKTSNEHKCYIWTDFDSAFKLLKWDSNRTALWELNERILSGNLEMVQPETEIQMSVTQPTFWQKFLR